MVDSTRRFAARLATVATLCVLAASTPLHATVGALLHADGAVCSLANAIRSANSNADTGGCVASGGYGSDTIDLEYDVSLLAAEATSIFDQGARAGLPDVTTTMSIVGVGASGRVIERGNAGSLGCVASDPASFRLLNVIPGGSLTLSNLTLRNGCVAPDVSGVSFGAPSGGAILAKGNALSLQGVTFSGNQVIGPTSDSAKAPRAALGGAIAATGVATINMNQVGFVDNQAHGGDAVTTQDAGDSLGGALSLFGGTVTLYDVEFSGNLATAGFSPSGQGGVADGGAVYASSSHFTTFHRVLFAANQAIGGSSTTWKGGRGQGGALSASNVTIDAILGSAFRDDEARGGSSNGAANTGDTGTGGAIYLLGGTISAITRSTFLGNVARGGNGNPALFAGYAEGGGMALQNGATVNLIDSSTFAGNVAHTGTGNSGGATGGAIFDAGTLALLRNSTLAGNQAITEATSFGFAQGGAVYRHAAAVGGTTASDLFADNTVTALPGAPTGQDCSQSGGTFSDDGYSLMENPGSCPTAAGTIVGVDPGLAAPADNGCLTTPPAGKLPDGTCAETILFPPTSAAVDNGNCDAAVTIDQRGVFRPQDFATVTGPGNECDIGAVELVPTVNLALDVTAAPDPVGLDPVPVDLTCSIVLSNGGAPATAASEMTVAISLTLPAGVTVSQVSPSTGSYDSGTTTWTVPFLDVNSSATLTVQLALAPDTAPGIDVVDCAAAVTGVAQSQQGGVLPSDFEKVTVNPQLHRSSFEPGDPAWSYGLPP